MDLLPNRQLLKLLTECCLNVSIMARLISSRSICVCVLLWNTSFLPSLELINLNSIFQSISAKKVFLIAIVKQFPIGQMISVYCALFYSIKSFVVSDRTPGLFYWICKPFTQRMQKWFLISYKDFEWSNSPRQQTSWKLVLFHINGQNHTESCYLPRFLNMFLNCPVVLLFGFHCHLLWPVIGHPPLNLPNSFPKACFSFRPEPWLYTVKLLASPQFSREPHILSWVGLTLPSN